MLLTSIDSFRGYSPSNSKVVRNRAEFWTFLPSEIFLGARLQNVVHKLSRLPRGTSSGKFREVTLNKPKVICTHKLNFKPNFKYSPLKFIGDPIPKRVEG